MKQASARNQSLRKACIVIAKKAEISLTFEPHMMNDGRGVVQEPLERIQLAVDGGRPSLHKAMFSALPPVPNLARHSRWIHWGHILSNLSIPCRSKPQFRPSNNRAKRRTITHQETTECRGSTVPVTQETHMEVGE